MHRVLVMMLVLVLVIAIAGCAGRQTRDGTEAALPADSIFVEALNEHFYDARVHAVFSGGQRHSLGTIAGNGGRARTALAWEPHALVFEVSFIISGAAYVSHPVDVTRGEHVEVTLPANINQSGFFRRVSRNGP